MSVINIPTNATSIAICTLFRFNVEGRKCTFSGFMGRLYTLKPSYDEILPYLIGFKNAITCGRI